MYNVIEAKKSKKWITHIVAKHRTVVPRERNIQQSEAA